MKEKDFDFKVSWYFFIEIKYYTIQVYLKKNVDMSSFVVILDIDLAINTYCLLLWSWDYSAHALRYTNQVFEKSICY